MKHLAKVAAIAVVFLVQGCAAAVPALILTGGSVVAPKVAGEVIEDNNLSNARKAAELRKTTDKRSCIANYSIEHVGERDYLTFNMSYNRAKTFEDFQKITKERAFSNILSAMSSDGLTVLNSNKDSGIISTGDNLNVIVTNNTSGGIRVELSCRIEENGFSFELDKIQDKFCRFLASVTQ